jgi:hypothetical protein
MLKMIMYFSFSVQAYFLTFNFLKFALTFNNVCLLMISQAY